MQRTTRTTTNQADRTVSGQKKVASTQVNRASGSQLSGAGNQTNVTSNGNIVVCRKCKSTQIVANKRGYSFAKMFTTIGIMILIAILLFVIGYLLFWYSSVDGTIAVLGIPILFLSLPVSILVGFIGRNEIVNGCMNCGFKWTPAKKK
jgi:nitrogen fixation-related uncharacterized protein